MTGDWGIGSLLRAGVLMLCILVLGFGGWGMFSQIAGAVIVPAYVDSGQDRYRLQHLSGGTVTAVLVENGDSVVKGQVLITLDDAHLQTELSILQEQHAALTARHARLQAEQKGIDLVFPPDMLDQSQHDTELATILRNEQDLFFAQRDLMTQALTQIENQRQQLDIQRRGIIAERKAAQNQFQLASNVWNDQKALLEKGLIQAERVSNIAQQVAALEGNLARLETAIANAGAQDAQIQMEAVRIKSNHHQQVVSELAETDVRLVQMNEKIRSLQTNIASQNITAPIAGQVHGMEFSVPGGVVRSGESILEILPNTGRNRAVANLDTAHIDQVFLGQTVTLRLPDFGLRDVPELEGVVNHISADAFVDQKTGYRFYRVDIEISDESINTLQTGHTLLPGMSAEAFLHTGYQRPLVYLTAPFLDYFRHAFRER